jgi:hypothetical protein
MKRVFIVLLCCAAFHVLATDPVKFYPSDSIGQYVDSLQIKMGTNKSYPHELEDALFVALSYYSEFDSTKIRVVRRNIKTTMQCQPTLLSVFRKPANRVYTIVVDNEKWQKDGIVFEELPFNAQVGVMGHELAHIVDYNKRSSMGLIKFGLNYLSPKKKRKIENSIDMITIERGLGYQLDDFAIYVFEESHASDEYKAYKRKFYFQPFQIRNILSTIPAYRFRILVADE